MRRVADCLALGLLAVAISTLVVFDAHVTGGVSEQTYEQWMQWWWWVDRLAWLLAPASFVWLVARVGTASYRRFRGDDRAL